MLGMVEQVGARMGRVGVLSDREDVLSAWRARPAAESSRVTSQEVVQLVGGPELVGVVLAREGPPRGSSA
jgi:hypothetical protein